MSDNWTISVAGQSYGPYTVQQLQAFVAEGRLAPHSLVAPAGNTQFRAAGSYPVLVRLFASAGPMPSATGKFVTAGGVESDEDMISPTFGRSTDEPRTGERARYLVIADMKSPSISGLEEEIFNLGPAYALMPQAWLLISDQPINHIRNALVQKLGKMDVLFLVDATHNKAAWFNFGPEADTRIRRVWTAQHEQIAKAG